MDVSPRLYPVEVRYAPGAAPDDGFADAEDAPDSAAARDERTNPPPEGPSRAAWAGETDYVEAAVAAVERILIESDAGDILVFMPSERDILETRDALREARFGPLELVPLFGRLSAEEQQRIFAPAPRRKVVIATNLAETSLTVPGIRFVVDTGLARVSRYSPRTRTRRLPIEPIAQSSARQRAGRCGRVAAGVCIRLYAEADLEARPAFMQPEIQRANLAEVILRLKAFRLGEIESFPFMNPPAPAAIQAGYRLLQELGALDEHRALTELGAELARWPVDPTIGRMILQARHEHALREVLIVAAGLSIQDPRERPLDQQAAAATAHRRFQDPRSDFLTLLNIWNAYHDTWESLRTQSQLRRFCKTHFLSYPRMREWRDIHAQLRDTLEESGGFAENAQPAAYAAVHRSILTGLWSHVALRKERNLYQLAGPRDVSLFPGSGLFDRAEAARRRPAGSARAAAPAAKPAQPRWAVGGEVVETSRVFFRTVAEIDPLWIVELGGHLCRRTHGEPYWDARSGRVLVRQRVTLSGLEVLERTVPHSQVDPDAAARLFIQAALVEEGLRDHFQGRGGAPAAGAAAGAGVGSAAGTAGTARTGGTTGPALPASSRAARAAVATADLEPGEALLPLPSRYAFLDHNSQLRHKIEVWQTQARQRLGSDLDTLLVKTYAAHLPSLSSVAELDRVLRDTLTASPGFLRFTARDWLGPRAAAFEAGAFPDQVKVGEQAVEVRYAYAPGEERDGITLRLPFTLAQVIEPGLLDWAVAGLREQQILHLLQALPKTQRRELMPLAPKAAELAQALSPGPAGLVPALAALVRDRYGVGIPADAWNLDLLPAHLRPRIEVLDAQQQPLAAGRDLRQLRTQVAAHEPAAQSRAWQHAVSRWERYELRAWDFGDLPERVHIEDVAGFPLHAFPALQLEDATLAVRLFRRAEEAEAAHRKALPALAERVLEREWAWLEKDLRALAPLKPLYVTLGPGEELTATAFDHIRRHLLIVPEPPPREEAAFQAWIQDARGQLPGLVTRFSGWIGEILRLRQGLLLHRKPYPGMGGDLDALLPRRFLDSIPLARLAHVPRYLKAIAVRADRAAVNPVKDAEKRRRVQPYLDAWRQIATGPRADADRARLDAARWLLEEFKVSAFAQELGTAESVSPTRLDEALAAARASA